MTSYRWNYRGISGLEPDRRQWKVLRLCLDMDSNPLYLIFVHCISLLLWPSIFISLLPSPRPPPLSLPPQRVEVIAPAGPQAVVATHWLLYLLWPASLFFVFVKQISQELYQGKISHKKKRCGIEHFIKTQTITTEHTWTGINHFYVKMIRWHPQSFHVDEILDVKLSVLRCFCIPPPQILC